MGGVKGKDGEKIIGEAWTEAEKRIQDLRIVLEGSCQ
jgi:hypothetical protein